MNLLRGDVARLGRCVAITTGSPATDAPMPRAPLSAADAGGGEGEGGAPSPAPVDAAHSGPCAADRAAAVPPLRLVPRCKPLKYAYEKEIVLYAYHKRLDYHSTECIYRCARPPA